MSGCQTYGPFLGPYYNTAPIGYPKRDHNFDNYPYGVSENKGPKYSTLNSRILIIRTQNKVPLIFGNSHIIPGLWSTILQYIFLKGTIVK